MSETTKKLTLPMAIQLDELSPDDFIAYYKKNESDIERDLLEVGAIKFQGIQIESMEVFQHIVNSIANKFLAYIDGNSPRTKLSGNVYTSTEYDKTQRITMHNELSYSAKWPGKLFFSCMQPSDTGGETLLADSREILNHMDKDLVDEIDKKGVIYIRNLHGGKGIGPSWQDTFETENKEQLEAYCKQYGIEFEWKEDDSLRLIQRSKGIVEHRSSGERVWFNQVDQFHPSHLDGEIYEMMQFMYESTEDFPMFVKFGDGTQITEAMVKEILNTTEKLTIAPPWERNELLIVDNELVSHGRNSFTGERRVLVSMTE
ncbi:TauD/TfdA family dioxygenase [Fulvivirga sp. 29W222]|uniref:TauD/TfdA family dioxygenase n=1 Tax=Fulvivirga marina TaxID=2494733 RepID=A0A937FY73_9BACT|nr:TauD/TfdA family dioxygenase [Fulvivirga marina]MBL6448214.1 TauD/TfdA family dioxygenase [Fulvivirga marina]